MMEFQPWQSLICGLVFGAMIILYQEFGRDLSTRIFVGPRTMDKIGKSYSLYLRLDEDRIMKAVEAIEKLKQQEESYRG